MADVSHNGAIYTIAASTTTAGIPLPLSSFPKDTAPFDVPDTDIRDMEIGTNGDSIEWDVQNPVVATCAIIPSTANHELLQRIYNANRSESGRRSNRDRITIVRILPNGEVTTMIGIITGGPATTSLDANGKIRTPTYTFKFHRVFRVPAIGPFL